jgi:hypothetical protein
MTPDSTPQASILDTVRAENATEARELPDRDREAKFLTDSEATYLRQLIERPYYWMVQAIMRRERVDEQSAEALPIPNRASHAS